jgi:O-antigen ligase
VFAFACGSSSVPSVTRAGHSLRWALLGLLLAAAALPYAQRRALPRLNGAAWAAAALTGLAFVSAAWSVEPRTSAERAISLGLLFTVCILLAELEQGRAVLLGVLAGAVAVALAGLVVLAAAHGHAVQPATYQGPARYQGFGQDPNTVALLAAVTTPLAVWALLDLGAWRARIPVLCALALLVGTIVASGSRGGLIAGGIGAAVVPASRGVRTWLIAAALTLALVVAGAAIQTIPKASPLTAAPAASTPAPAAPKAAPRYRNADEEYPLDADVGAPLPGGGQPIVRRSLFGASGRLDAWEGALHDVVRRPVVGHGFGTESDVFADRYYRFVGGLPENSYIGLALQLGIVGVLALVVLVAALARPGVRALRRRRSGLACAGLGVLAAGLAIAVVQSYVYSVGNLAAAALWIPAFLVPAVADA